MKRFLGISIVAIVLFGCGQEAEPDYDIAYYKSHDAERTAKLEWCEGNVKRKDTSNCQNAASAQAKLKIENLFGNGLVVEK